MMTMIRVSSIESHVWEQIETTGTKPSPRAGHSATIHGNTMVIFGGYDKDGLACNDTYKYHFGTPLPIRLLSCALSLAHWLTRSLAGSPDTRRWKKIIPAVIQTRGGEKATVPHDTFHHSAVVYQGSMYVLGGYRCSYSSLLEYRFGTETWSTVHTTGTMPSPRWGHRAVVYKNSMFLFGGRDAVGNTNDLFELSFGMGCRLHRACAVRSLRSHPCRDARVEEAREHRHHPALLCVGRRT